MHAGVFGRGNWFDFKIIGRKSAFLLRKICVFMLMCVACAHICCRVLFVYLSPCVFAPGPRVCLSCFFISNLAISSSRDLS